MHKIRVYLESFNRRPVLSEDEGKKVAVLQFSLKLSRHLLQPSIKSGNE